MSVSKVNDSYYRKFIINHLDNKFELEDLYDVVATLNPANNLYKTKSTSTKYTESENQFDSKTIYEFRTDNAASLFVSTYQNLVQKGSSLIQVKAKDNKVLLGLKEPVVVSHTRDLSQMSDEQRGRVSQSIAFREDSHLLSDVFIQTVDALFSSGLYNFNSPNDKPSKRNIKTKEEFEKYEKLIQKIENRTNTEFYKAVVKNNAIPLSPKLNNEVMEQINSAMNDRVDGIKGAYLGKKIFRFSAIDSNPSNSLQMDNRIKSILEQMTMVSEKKKKEEKSLLGMVIDKIKPPVEETEKEKQAKEDKLKKSLKFRYK